MKKYSYVLGDGKIPDFLAKFGLITRIGEDNDLILINSFPKMLHKVTRIIKVNGMSPIKKESWHLGINTIQNENGEIFAIPLMPLDPKTIIYPPLINNHFVMMQIITLEIDYENFSSFAHKPWPRYPDKCPTCGNGKVEDWEVFKYYGLFK